MNTYMWCKKIKRHFQSTFQEVNRLQKKNTYYEHRKENVVSNGINFEILIAEYPTFNFFSMPLETGQLLVFRRHLFSLTCYGLSRLQKHKVLEISDSADYFSYLNVYYQHISVIKLIFIQWYETWFFLYTVELSLVCSDDVMMCYTPGVWGPLQN